MPLESGQSLLHYRLVEKIGEGGMGVVWKALDTSLDREVAIKILPDRLAADAERLARFEREARLLASLNHDNIATIHGIEQAEGLRFLIMELVEGEDLSERLARGPVAVEDVLALAVQLAEALEWAHEQGVIHRDLKPANVKLTPAGKIKVLDFGLAKAFEPAGTSSDPSLSPTVTSAGTMAGVILGTASYMSPEQAKGQAVDRRADIWAFGVVLYEMLSGHRLFDGRSVSEVIAAVLMADPDLTRLPARTPDRIRRLVERCLRRDPASRLRDVGDARVVIEEALAGREWDAPAQEKTGTKHRRGFVGAALLVAAGLVVGAGLASLFRGPAAPAAVTRVTVPIDSTLWARFPLLTPDGRTVVFNGHDTGPDSDRRNRIYVHRLDEYGSLAIEGSANAERPAISPDGAWIAFLARASERSSRWQILKAPLDRSAPPVKIADLPSDAGYNTIWPTADRIVVVRDDGAMHEFDASNGRVGEAVEIVRDPPPVELWANAVLPDRRHLLAHYASFETGEYRRDLGVIDLATGKLTKILDDGSYPVYVAPGYLLFTRRNTLLGARFDPKRLEITGGAQSLIDGVWSAGLWTGGQFGVSASGDLAYPAGRVQGVTDALEIVTRDGEVTRWSPDLGPYNNVRISPDGRRVAVVVDNITEGDALLQVRVSAIDRPRLVTVGSHPARDCTRVKWSSDSQRIAYACSDQSGASVHVANLDDASTTTLVTEVESPTSLVPVGFLAGGSHVLVQREQAGGASELISLAVGTDSESPDAPRVIPMEADRWWNASLSRDGKWLAYRSDSAGRRGLYARELLGTDALGPRVVVAGSVDRLPRWGKMSGEGGYELAYFQDHRLYSVQLETSDGVRVSNPVDLGIADYELGIDDMDCLPDGRFMIIALPDTWMGSRDLRLVLNWSRDLARRIP